MAQGGTDLPFRPSLEPLRQNEDRTATTVQLLIKTRSIFCYELIIEQYPPQPGDVELTNADVSKARELLGYAPTTSFEQGMREFNEWFSANV